MATTLTIAGDVNLMNVTRPDAPFARVSDVLHRSDIRFANLECCFYKPTAARSLTDEGFYADPEVVQALRIAGFQAVGPRTTSTTARTRFCRR